jgi:cell division protein FtsN
MLGGLALGLLVAAGVYVSGARMDEGGSQAAATAARGPAARAATGGAPRTATGAAGRAATDGTASAAARTKPSAPATSASASSASPSSASPSSTSASTAKTSAQPSSTGRNGGRAADPKKTGSRETQFDFYEILPQYEVVVPEVETVTATPQPRAAASDGSATAGAKATSVAPVEAPGEYILQAGSFRSHDEADRMQASLALLGIESRIQKVTIDDDEFHRVRVGPIDDLETLNRIRNQLRVAGINALVMRMNE